MTDVLPPPPDLSVLDVAERIALVDRLVARAPSPDRLERLAAAAAALLGASGAAVTLVAAAEQVVAAAHGTVLPDDGRRKPLAESLCALAAASCGPLAVADARSHPWVGHLPVVVSGELRAYLGVPLVDREGLVLGALCVTDVVPREWTPEQVARLTTVAGLASAELDDQAGDSAVRLQLAVQAADLGSYEYDLPTGELVWDARMLALHGCTEEGFSRHVDAYSAVVHPDDLDRVQEALAHAVSVVGDLVVDYRVVLPDGGIRWIRGRGRVLPDMLGAAARVVGTAYDASADRELRDELTRLMETMPAAFVRLDRQWRFSYVNARAEAIYGRTRHELVGADVYEAFPEVRGSAFDEVYTRAMDHGESGRVDAFFAPLDTHFEVYVWPDELGLSIFFHDVTDRMLAHAALARASDRMALLSAAGESLSASLQPRECLAVLADLVVPDLAAWLVLVVTDAVAELLGEPGAGGDPTRLHVVHLAHEDPEREQVLRQVVRAQVMTREASSGVGKVVRTGEPEGYPRVPDEVMAARASGPEQLAAMRALNGGAVLSVPLHAATGVQGGFTVGSRDDQPLDDALVVDLAARAGVALDNALAYARERREAAVLQSALLPREPAHLPDVVLATRYLPASADALAGGDFFKTVRVDGRMVLMLGDVMGHGTASAARAGQLHGLGAALALEGHRPGALLARLAAGIDQMMDLELATLLVCSYDPADRVLTTASAGHPAPLVAPPAGPPAFLEVAPGPPLGVPGGDYAEGTVVLAPGSSLVLFTDGLVERRGESITVGLERLRAALDELRLPPEQVADHLLRECGRIEGGDDDVALLVLAHG